MLSRTAIDLLAVDPSLTSTGVALFRKGELRAARRIKRERDGTRPGERAHAMAFDVWEWLCTVKADPRCFVYEFPQIYTIDKSDGDPNDLTPLAAIGGALGGMLGLVNMARNAALDIVTPKPAEWAGQLPKTKTGDPWASPRGHRIKRALSVEELRRFQAQHDVLDAIGLGLWALGRFDRQRVVTDGTDAAGDLANVLARIGAAKE